MKLMLGVVFKVQTPGNFSPASGVSPSPPSDPMSENKWRWESLAARRPGCKGQAGERRRLWVAVPASSLVLLGTVALLLR